MVVAETPLIWQTYRLDMPEACRGEFTAHGIRPYLHGELVRIIWRESNSAASRGHVYKCEVLSGPVAGTHQFIAPSELLERDIDAEIAALR